MEIFPISPASAKPVWILAMVCVLLAAILVALAYTAYSARHSRVVLQGDSIKLEGDLWGRTIPLEQLDLSGAAVLDLESARDYQLKRRTLGTGLPGYATGWFRLRAGEKALVYLTNRERVAYVPTLRGYALLLSVEDPERFIAALRRQIDSH